MRLILVATDGSESANRAVDAAAKLAKGFDATLLIANAVDHNILAKDEISQFRRTEGISLGDALEAMSLAILTQAERQARTHLSSIETASLDGEPAKAVLEIAHERGVDAVVVGRRGRGQLAGLLLGSTSQKLVTLAPCLVIVVP
jgi:nucleotide-binding universal stress UspA family protein